MASNPYASLVLESPHYRLLERFTIVLYNKTSNLEDVDEARMELFCQRSRSMENIPPTRDALLHHAKRAVYQASVWATSEQIQLNRPSPETWGWQWDKDTKSWTPVWTTSPIASKACLELIKCSCVDAKKPILCVLNSANATVSNKNFHCNYIFAFLKIAIDLQCTAKILFFAHTEFLKSVRVHFAYGSDGRSFFVEYS